MYDNALKNVKVGLDPEFFVKDVTGKIVPATNYPIPGTKENKYDLGDGVLIQLDNVAVELDIPPTLLRYDPNNALNSNAFYDKMTVVMDKVDEFLSQFGLSLVRNRDSYDFAPEDLQTMAAWVFGCDPDYDCWFIDSSTQLDPSQIMGFRSVGGHIHLSYDTVVDVQADAVARTLDLTVGLPMAFAEGIAGMNTSKRRSLYGQAGRFRPKSYGLEYRTPSNSWLYSQYIIDLTWRWLSITADQPTLADRIINQDKGMAVLIKDTINNNDHVMAGQLIQEFGLFSVYEEANRLATYLKGVNHKGDFYA